MYESPIDVYIQEAVKSYEEQRDNKICQYITEKFNVNVDRGELIRALNYDRGQYEKGYHDAKMEYEQKMQEMIAEISVCKTENEMRIAERDYKSRLWISGIFSEIVGIIHKYCDKGET